VIAEPSQIAPTLTDQGVNQAATKQVFKTITYQRFKYVAFCNSLLFYVINSLMDCVVGVHCSTI